MNQKKRNINGFTLIELMLVVAIISLLAAISIPKFGAMVIKAKEAAVKGKLGALRSALSIYYADNEGMFPRDVFLVGPALTRGGKYLDQIPEISIPSAPQHAPSRAIADIFGDWVANYGWNYPNPSTGHIFVSCTHTDTKNNIWSTI